LAVWTRTLFWLSTPFQCNTMMEPDFWCGRARLRMVERACELVRRGVEVEFERCFLLFSLLSVVSGQVCSFSTFTTSQCNTVPGVVVELATYLDASRRRDLMTCVRTPRMGASCWSCPFSFFLFLFLDGCLPFSWTTCQWNTRFCAAMCMRRRFFGDECWC
jgi:hypothetical protein